jgi:hypothetical protein
MAMSDIKKQLPYIKDSMQLRDLKGTVSQTPEYSIGIVSQILILGFLITSDLCQ